MSARDRHGRFTRTYVPGDLVTVVKPGSEREGFTGRVIRQTGTGTSYIVHLGDAGVRTYHADHLAPHDATPGQA